MKNWRFLLLGFAEHCFEELFVHHRALCNSLSELEKIDGILPRNLLRIEGSKSQECLDRHIGCEPVSVLVFRGIPEEFLLLSDAVNRFDQTPWEQVCECPYYLIHFLIEEFEIEVVIFEFLIDPAASFFKLIAAFKIAVYDLTVIYLLIGNDLGIADPLSFIVLEHGDAFGDERL